jgi:S1-C subfamily serine protease
METVTSTRTRPFSLIAGLLLLAAVLIVGAISAAFLINQKPSAANVRTGASASASGGGPAQTPMAPSAIYKQAVKGVVTITTQVGSGRRGSGTGSGIVLDHNGSILTNNHVVQGANQIQVTFSDGSTVDASVVNTNPSQDLATIRVAVSAASLHPLTLGNSDNVLIGDSVYAIGAPFGHQESMVAGIVSGLNRTDPSSGLHGLIQTDARINPGNSGGPLLDTLGRVIGINDAIDSPIQGNVGVGFAIPINVARPAGAPNT